MPCEFVTLTGDRSNNQDRARAFENRQCQLLVLADGMGGHSDGAAAAQTVIESAAELFDQFSDLPGPQLMQRIALTAHQQLSKRFGDRPDAMQPRTTVVMCHLQGKAALFAHAGDSRAYLIRDGMVAYRSRDHSVVEALVQQQQISEAEAKKHPMRNQVTRCIGGLGRPALLELTPCPPLRLQDQILLCSDGFWEPLSEEELCSGRELPELAAIAVERNSGRADNCTALRQTIKSV